ncbi:NUDIX domain-containing protein [Lysinibacillus sp. JK80]|uniref:NUDIX domain-containing protein n=1 Tax=Lysinibacillus sp. JK80 TaxID=2749809 RepID=UPI0022B97180|nr:NUDIX domain-containing protein [Lysinibacillus sp. JK80]
MKRSTSVLNNVWCYIGGGIEEGEMAWESAVREVKEETGIQRFYYILLINLIKYIHQKKIIFMLHLYLLDM